MRTSLQRLLVKPTALRILRAVVELPRCPRISLASSASGVGHIGIRIVGRRHKHDLAIVVRDQDYGGPSLRSTSASKYLDGSTEIREEVKSTGVWKSRLTTFEQYQYESDLGRISNQGSRLVDDLSYGADFELWLELIWFRRRRKDVEGGDAIWEEIQKRNLQIPTEGPAADDLWSRLVQFGDLKNVVAYAQWIRKSTGNAWQGLYVKIISHCLSTKPRNAYRWHKRLPEEFLPSSEQLKQLFERTVSRERTLTVFKAIYKDLPNRDMYATIIPHLCNKEQYRTAVKWHNFLMKINDIPSSSISAEPLLHYLAIHGRNHQFMEIVNGMVHAGVSFEGSDDKIFKHKALISREIVNRELGNNCSIAPMVVSDGFCARLFATTTFSIDTIINCLRVLGIKTIGPLSLRELAWREGSSPVLCCQRIDQLKGAGINLGDSTFSTLVVSLASKNEGQLLQEVINCDMHPDAFEDKKLQRTLLDSYHQSGDILRVDRSLAILTVKLPPRIHWNVLLRSSLKRQDTAKTYQILDTMQEHQIPISAKSSTYVRIYMLSTRQVSQPPIRIDDVQKVIAIFQRILRAKGEVSPFEWKEILRRLGMMGRLIELENVSIWLADWYANPKAPASQLSRFHQKSHRTPGPCSLQHSQHPLRAIFSAPLQKAIIAWGFQHTSHIVKGAPDFGDNGLTWRWGLELLRKLARRNVPIQRDTVLSGCRLRLIALFGNGRSRRVINQRAQAMNKQSIEHFGREIESICGRDIFCIDPSLPRGHPKRNLRLEDWVKGK